MPDEPSIPGMEELANRERPSAPATPAEMEVIHQRALLAGRAALDVKGEDVRVLDMHDLVSYTDYLVICTARNTRLAKRVSEEIGFRLKGEGALPAGLEGGSGGEWVLMDYLDFVVHIFTPEAREFYRLDVLWKQAPVEVLE